MVIWSFLYFLSCNFSANIVFKMTCQYGGHFYWIIEEIHLLSSENFNREGGRGISLGIFAKATLSALPTLFTK